MVDTGNTSPRLKVLVVTEALGGGILSSLANSCNALNPSEFDVTLVYSRRAETPDEEYLRRIFGPEVRLLRVQGARSINPVQDIKLMYNYWALFGREQPDVIHLHSSKAGLAGRIAARLAGVRKVFYSPRGYAFLRRDVPPVKRKLYHWLERLGALFGGVTVAVSASEADAARQVNEPDRVRLIENAVDSERILEYGAVGGPTRQSQIVLATVGRLTQQKNPDMFLTVAKRILDQEPSARFHWIGGGELSAAFAAKAIELGIDHAVTCTGWLSRERAWAMLGKEVDIYLQTSLWEGMPLTVLEAMALSKPIVVSDCVGNRDVVEQGHNGWVVHTPEEMVQRVIALMRNAQLRQETGQRGKRMIDTRFSVTRLGRELEQLYREA